MTRQDFELIAGVVRGTPMPEGTRVELACAFITALKPTNLRFNEERFYDACTRVGVEGQ